MSDIPRSLAYHLATSIDTAKRLDSDHPWNSRWRALARECLDELPHGSGLDGTWAILWDSCKPDKIVLTIDYHHMNDNGYYDGWSAVTVTIRPDWSGVRLNVTGARINTPLGPGDYLHECIDYALGLLYTTVANSEGGMSLARV